MLTTLIAFSHDNRVLKFNIFLFTWKNILSQNTATLITLASFDIRHPLKRIKIPYIVSTFFLHDYDECSVTVHLFTIKLVSHYTTLLCNILHDIFSQKADTMNLYAVRYNRHIYYSIKQQRSGNVLFWTIYIHSYWMANQ